MPERSDISQMLEEVNRDTERFHAFIDGYGATLADISDNTIDDAMTKEEFREHLESRWEEFDAE